MYTPKWCIGFRLVRVKWELVGTARHYINVITGDIRLLPDKESWTGSIAYRFSDKYVMPWADILILISDKKAKSIIEDLKMQIQRVDDRKGRTLSDIKLEVWGGTITHAAWMSREYLFSVEDCAYIHPNHRGSHQHIATYSKYFTYPT